MSSKIQMLERPWGRYTSQVVSLEGGDFAVCPKSTPFLQILGKSSKPPAIKGDGSFQLHVEERGSAQSNPWTMLALSRSIDPSDGFTVQGVRQSTRIFWPSVPKRPKENQRVKPKDDQRAQKIMSSVHAVRARIQAIEVAQDEPISLWERVADLWNEDAEDVDAEMDILAKQALELKSVIRYLEKSPRKILSRNRAMTPLSRVQEMDRAGMLWLSRQPGNDWAERAGPSQRILAPTRYESANTLENRVLRSFAALSDNTARNYLNRNNRAQRSARYQRIKKHGLQCRRLERTLADLGVTLAPPDTTPNYVLQNDVRYHRIWSAYQQLLKREKPLDDLWKWQARSWEEFCIIAVAVACRGIPGAKVIAAAPINFREEHSCGLWLEHDNPLVTLYLKEQDLIVEILVRQKNVASRQNDLGAPCIIKCSKFTTHFARRIPVWPMHSFDEMNPQDDIADLENLFQSPGFRSASSLNIKGAIVLRNTYSEGTSRHDITQLGGSKVLASTIGPRGPALRSGLNHLSEYIAQIFEDLSR